LEPAADRGEAISEEQSWDDVAAAEEAPQVLKLGAEPRPGTEGETAPEPQPSPDRDEAVADEEAWGGVPAEGEEPQVLKLKASPPPEPEPEETLGPDSDAGPSSSEDWWVPTDKGQE
jgi:hypothetical protein